MKRYMWFSVAVGALAFASTAMAAEPVPASPPATAAAVTLAQAPANPAGPRQEEGGMAVGKPDAPVTIIEYASLTCPHCATFSEQTVPRLKAEYVEKGLVRFVFRDFPLDRVALTGALLPHCAGPERYFGFLDVLFRQQMAWARAADPVKALAALARQGGMGQEAFDACLKNQEVLNYVLAASLKGEKEHGVHSTPTLVINGKVYEGALSFEELDKILRPLVAGKS